MIAVDRPVKIHEPQRGYLESRESTSGFPIGSLEPPRGFPIKIYARCITTLINFSERHSLRDKMVSRKNYSNLRPNTKTILWVGIALVVLWWLSSKSLCGSGVGVGSSMLRSKSDRAKLWLTNTKNKIKDVTGDMNARLFHPKVHSDEINHIFTTKGRLLRSNNSNIDPFNPYKVNAPTHSADIHSGTNVQLRQDDQTITPTTHNDQVSRGRSVPAHLQPQRVEIVPMNERLSRDVLSILGNL